MMTGAAVKLIEQAIDHPSAASTFAVLEQEKDENGDFVGIRKFKDDDLPD